MLLNALCIQSLNAVGGQDVGFSSVSTTEMRVSRSKWIISPSSLL